MQMKYRDKLKGICTKRKTHIDEDTSYQQHQIIPQELHIEEMYIGKQVGHPHLSKYKLVLLILHHK